jgi:hypothetical protein
MRVCVPANSQGQLLDLDGCTVTFLGRPKGNRAVPPPIVREMESFQQETADADDVAALNAYYSRVGASQRVELGDALIAAYIHFEEADTKQVTVPGSQTYTEMEGELEIVDGDDETLTTPSLDYIKWYIRDDIGDGA